MGRGRVGTQHGLTCNRVSKVKNNNKSLDVTHTYNVPPGSSDSASTQPRAYSLPSGYIERLTPRPEGPSLMGSGGTEIKSVL